MLSFTPVFTERYSEILLELFHSTEVGSLHQSFWMLFLLAASFLPSNFYVTPWYIGIKNRPTKHIFTDNKSWANLSLSLPGKYFYTAWYSVMGLQLSFRQTDLAPSPSRESCNHISWQNWNLAFHLMYLHRSEGLSQALSGSEHTLEAWNPSG